MHDIHVDISLKIREKKNPDPQSSGTLLKMEVNLNLYHFSFT